ncbi:hypothetical protein LP037_029 [Listeria phage LP-037]|uniref:Uncharacterized protein n=3 Tax=Homburgvirus TaxID=1921125 RepID=S4U8K5_9CAUD|nr:hypothetical protein LP037_029 [Listeria phage LP-037]AGI11644.1 hypothetical protein LP037_029 [Listeria phage LP-037]QDK04665.1 hypothetical protein FK482_0043 [Listeria phage LP-013]QDK04776.1 hypothetical protein FK484_0043 [Listeria phage LP-031]
METYNANVVVDYLRICKNGIDGGRFSMDFEFSSLSPVEEMNLGEFLIFQESLRRRLQPFASGKLLINIQEMEVEKIG